LQKGRDALAQARTSDRITPHEEAYLEAADAFFAEPVSRSPPIASPLTRRR
jgi:hypothetical protein